MIYEQLKMTFWSRWAALILYYIRWQSVSAGLKGGKWKERIQFLLVAQFNLRDYAVLWLKTYLVSMNGVSGENSQNQCIFKHPEGHCVCLCWDWEPTDGRSVKSAVKYKFKHIPAGKALHKHTRFQDQERENSIFFLAMLFFMLSVLLSWFDFDMNINISALVSV